MATADARLLLPIIPAPPGCSCPVDLPPSCVARAVWGLDPKVATASQHDTAERAAWAKKHTLGDAKPVVSVGEDLLQSLECAALAALGALLGALDSLNNAAEAEHVPAKHTPSSEHGVQHMS